MITNTQNKKNISGVILLLAAFILSSASCSDDPDDCGKCIDHKPAATEFSNALNAISHGISHDQAISMIQNFEEVRDSILKPERRGADILPFYETFNLKAIDSLICQKAAVGFRIYMAMDDEQKVRFVLVGVDGDGKDIIQRKRLDPAKEFSSGDNVSLLVEEAGQRWP